MKAAGEHRPTSRGKIISLAIVAIAVAAGVYASFRSARHPSTDDATIDADVVHIAAVVGGRIIDIAVTENGTSRKATSSFRSIRCPIVLQSRRRTPIWTSPRRASTRSAACYRPSDRTPTIAADQVQRAVTNGELATRTVEGFVRSRTAGYVPTQQFDQAEVANMTPATSLRQAPSSRRPPSSHRYEAGAEATVRAREAALAIATACPRRYDRARAARRTSRRACPSCPARWSFRRRALFTLIDTEAWYAVANFRETDLDAIAVGDCVTVYSMINRGQPIKGVVRGIGSGVLDADRVNLPRSVPYVERSLNWVKVAQRFPVRVRLEDPPQRLMRLGARAVVEVKHGAACK